MASNRKKLTPLGRAQLALGIIAIFLLIVIVLTSSFMGVILLRKNTVPQYKLHGVVEDTCIHTDLQKSFLEDDFYWHISSYANGKKELSHPQAVVLHWDEALPEGCFVMLKEGGSTEPKRYAISPETNTITLYNLKVGTTYFFYLYEPNSPFTLDWGKFTTSTQAPRNMYVDGVTNVRDLGGWSIPGGRVKQGLIYRCSRLNENKTEAVTLKITQKGIDTMLNEMHVKSEIDLRKTSDNEVGCLTDTSVLGENVNYYQCPMGYTGNMLINNKEMVKHIFSDILSKEENYPIIFHCSIGTDRTGLIAFLINGLLGVDINDLYRDYLFSNFGDIGGDRDILGITFDYVSTLEGTKGKNISEKIENYLLGIGVQQEELDSIRTILSEKMK